MKRNYFIFLLLMCQTVNAQVITQKVTDNAMKGLAFETPFRSLPKYPQPDLQKIFKEDVASSELPERIAVGFDVNIDLQLEKPNYGDKGKAWSVKLEADKSRFLSLFFDDLYLPKGSELYIYNRKNQVVVGPLDYTNTSESRTFQMGLIKGEELTLTLIETPAAFGKSRVHVKTLFYGYKESSEDGGGFGQSVVCNTDENVNCPVGAPFAQQSDAVAMILLNNDQSLRHCSATLLNNACQNLRPNLLTAFHCVDRQTRDGVLTNAERADVGNFGFVFQYKSPICSNANGSLSLTFSGSTILSEWNQTDFILLSLNSRPSPNSGIRYAGWDRSNVNPTSSAGIHHPAGDVMKIAIDGQASTLFTWNNTRQGFSPNLTDGYWEQNFDSGATEGGSSGSALFDQNRRVVGQLRGNQHRTQLGTECTDRRAHYGRLAFSWTGGGTSASRLSDHLSDDPSVMTTNTMGIPSFGLPDEICANTPISYLNFPPNMNLIGGSIVGVNMTGWLAGLEPQSGYNGEGHLEFQFKPNGITCNDPLIVRKDFWVGPPLAPQISFTPFVECYGFTIC